MKTPSRSGGQRTSIANGGKGSLADLFGNDRRMSASAGKADVSRTIVDSKILNVCFSQ